MQASLVAALAVASLAQARSSSNTSVSLETDINKIQRYWGQISPYTDNAESLFGVEDVGLPDGCAIEQAHLLQRHANRGPTSYFDDGINDDRFAQKLANWNGSATFSGPLSFLNTYSYPLNSDGYLTNLGAQTEFAAGASFWNRYGRLLFDAVPGQLAYNATYSNGTARPKPVLRTTSQSRMVNTEINWALGFFGPSFLVVPDPTLANATSAFDVLVIPEGGSENNTLAAYDSCFGDYVYDVGYMGDLDLTTYIPKYLAAATERLSQYVPDGFNLTANDTYAMQSICAYETTSMGESQFCGFFTLEEWDGFELTLDTEYYYDYSWGQPTGRAQGIGYLQELLARLQNEYIDVSNTSVNSTLTDNPTTFPLGREFYADFSHDDIIISVLTAMSMDYFKDAPDYTQYPADPDRKFKVSEMTPFGARLVTEVIGCSSASPTAKPDHSTVYSRSANGYNAENATYKFIRQRLNNAILPLDSIRGGLCSGRSDGLCSLTDFIQSQSNSTELSNYQYSCFGNYTINYDEAIAGIDWDGTIFP